MRWPLLIWLAGGCHYVLGLDERREPQDAAPDTTPIDAPFDATRCPGNYVKVASLPSRYRVVLSNANFADQDLGCRGDAPGLTHLALVETEPEAFALDGHLESIGDTYYWIGLTQAAGAAAHDEGWTWLSGRPIDPSLWASVEPNDGSDGIENSQEDHGMFSKSGAGSVVDAPEAQGHLAICECDGITLER